MDAIPETTLEALYDANETPQAGRTCIAKPQGPWADPAVCKYLVELCAKELTNSEMAAAIYAEFHIHVSRNAVIGRRARTGLAHKGRPRTPPKPRVRTEEMKKPKAPKPLGIEFSLHGLEATDLPPELASHPVTVAGLESHHCRWPIGDPTKPDFVFCGATALEDKPYCHRHCTLAYNRVRVRMGDAQVTVNARRLRKAKNVALLLGR